MKNAARIRREIVWKLGAMVLGLSTAMIATSRNLPASVSPFELSELKAGSGSGLNFAYNQTTNSANSCWYCASVSPPSSGAVGCADVSQYLGSGARKYTVTKGVTCNPEFRYSTATCSDAGMSTGLDCTSSKTTFADP